MKALFRRIETGLGEGGLAIARMGQSKLIGRPSTVTIKVLGVACLEVVRGVVVGVEVECLHSLVGKLYASVIVSVLAHVEHLEVLHGEVKGFVNLRLKIRIFRLRISTASAVWRGKDWENRELYRH